MKLINWIFNNDNSTVVYFFDKNGQEIIKRVNRCDFSKHLQQIEDDRPQPPNGILEREHYDKQVEDEEYDFFNNYFDDKGNENHDLSTIEIIEGGICDEY